MPAEGCARGRIVPARPTVLARAVLSPSESHVWHERVARLAEGGGKILACAWRPVDDAATAEPDEGYRLAGLLAFGDPVREGVVEDDEHFALGGIGEGISQDRVVGGEDVLGEEDAQLPTDLDGALNDGHSFNLKCGRRFYENYLWRWRMAGRCRTGFGAGLA